MIKTVIVVFVLAVFAACGAPPPSSPTLTSGVSIVSQQADPATGSVVVNVKVARSATEQEIKASAESIIASRKARYQQVIVKSFLDGADLEGTPLAISTSRGSSVDHVFDHTQGASERIPTH